MTSQFRLLMLSAMYENGGNATHRFFDGHPELFVYPFESQLGTRLVADHLVSLFPVKYRWPVFALDATPGQDYQAIIDEECRIRARTPHVSKFRHVPFHCSDDERGEIYRRWIEQTGRSRAYNVAAFFRATFDAWRNLTRTHREAVYVGYSPIVVVDADKILFDFPHAHVVHVVRNPWSAYAETKKRPVPLLLQPYMLGWTINQYFALQFKERFPDRIHIVRYEDVAADPLLTLGRICEAIGVEPTDSLKTLTWNGSPLEEACPWGTIRNPTTESNRATAAELSPEERREIRICSASYLEIFDYKNFL